MTDWPEQFAEHPIFQSLRDLEDQWEGTKVQAEQGPPAAAEDHARLGHVIRRIASILEAVDPLAASTNHMNSAQNGIQRAGQELQNFRSNHNHQHLTQANVHAENGLVQANILPRVEEPKDVESIHESVVSFRRSLGQHLRHFEQEIADIRAGSRNLEEKLQSLIAEVQQQKTRTDEALRRFESQFSESESERRKESQQYVTKLQDQISESEQRFLDAQENRQEKASQLLEKLEDQGKRQIAAMKDSLAEEKQTYSDGAAALLDDLQKEKAKAQEIVGAIAQTGMAGGYQKVANEEKNAMRAWQAVTVASIIGFVLLMLFVVPDGSQDWLAFSGRTLAALGLAALAAYAGREAAKHSEKERHNRRLELEIASIGPFLTGIPEDEQHVVLKQVADRTFGRGTQPLLLEDHQATTSGLIELLRMMFGELVKKVG